MADLYH